MTCCRLSKPNGLSPKTTAVAFHAVHSVASPTTCIEHELLNPTGLPGIEWQGGQCSRTHSSVHCRDIFRLSATAADGRTRDDHWPSGSQWKKDKDGKCRESLRGNACPLNCQAKLNSAVHRRQCTGDGAKYTYHRKRRHKHLALALKHWSVRRLLADERYYYAAIRLLAVIAYMMTSGRLKDTHRCV